MLITKEDAQKLDLILSYLVKNDTAVIKLKQIRDLLNNSLEEARYLYESILRYHNEVESVISIHNASNIAKKPRVTEEFMKRGGFMAVYEQQFEVKANTQTVNLKNNRISACNKWKKKTYWLTFSLSVLGFIIAVISLLIGLKIIGVD